MESITWYPKGGGGGAAPSSQLPATSCLWASQSNIGSAPARSARRQFANRNPEPTSQPSAPANPQANSSANTTTTHQPTAPPESPEPRSSTRRDPSEPVAPE